jgi:hypothetical protein
MSVVQIENLRIEIPADVRQEGEAPPSSPRPAGSWSDVAAEEARRLQEDAEREEYWAMQRWARSTVLAQRRMRQDKENRVMEEAVAAAMAVKAGHAQAQFYFDTQCMYDLGLAIQAQMDKAGMYRKLGGHRFTVRENCVSVGFIEGGDKACFQLNELTGEIGVALYGSGGLGGNKWYVVAMHRPGSETQLRANYAGEYIVDLLRELALRKH